MRHDVELLAIFRRNECFDLSEFLIQSRIGVAGVPDITLATKIEVAKVIREMDDDSFVQLLLHAGMIEPANDPVD
jgi:DNA polymerase III alpha subunit (gram-positive type)